MPNRLRPISEDTFDPNALAQPPAPPSQSAPEEIPGASILFTALKALSQRTLIAISNLFVLAAAGSAFWLWLVTLPSPTVYQLVGLGLYGLLMLALVHLVLRRR